MTHLTTTCHLPLTDVSPPPPEDDNAIDLSTDRLVPPCEECEQNSAAILHCKECEQNLCAYCSDWLHKKGTRKGHSLTSLDRAIGDISQKTLFTQEREKALHESAALSEPGELNTRHVIGWAKFRKAVAPEGSSTACAIVVHSSSSEAADTPRGLPLLLLFCLLNTF